ncbi:hypothetical protein JKF63_07693 [Porcisia hertigi]|uniref:Uncharacterized protein n=1 Tax=Porcisia hertigi TaxID=2761500 RepID=A0A836LLZ1_9TRYP|nr:hypothetical protein JKF63_07693 [Porcisia hertigi]
MKVYFANPETRTSASTIKKMYLGGSIDHNQFIELCMGMATGLLEGKGDGSASARSYDSRATFEEHPRNIQREMMHAQSLFSDKEMRKYLSTEDRNKRLLQRLSEVADPMEGLQARLEASIEAKLLTPIMAASAVILLGLAGPGAQEMSLAERITLWYEFFVHEPSTSRLYRYNTFITSALEGDNMEWREILSKVDTPLLPETARLARFNRIALEEARKEADNTATNIQGGGGHEKKSQRLFRRAKDDKHDLLEGGAQYAPILGPDGSQTGALDLSSWEEFAATLNAKLDALNANDRELASRILNERMRTQTRQTNQKSYQGRTYTNGGRRNGYGNGGAGGRGHTYRGGEPQENPKN